MNDTLLCVDCPDHEACMTGANCEVVKAVLSMSDEVKTNPEEQAMKDVLKDWWIDKTHTEIATTVPKAIEYSAVDLVEYGRTLAMIMDRGPISNEEATEIGIWGYLVGKIARWTGAVKEGRRPSDDTLHDLSIYIKMAQRNRDVGGWPFGPAVEYDERGLVK